MSTIRFRPIRYWLMRSHARGWFTPFCWDCRLLRSARRKGEFYVHDDPRWYIKEILARAEPAVLVTTPPPPRNIAVGTGQNWVWDVEHGARRVS